MEIFGHTTQIEDIDDLIQVKITLACGQEIMDHHFNIARVDLAIASEIKGGIVRLVVYLHEQCVDVVVIRYAI